jgi:outer membrane murein-binding lipoprotein Lpp
MKHRPARTVGAAVIALLLLTGCTDSGSTPGGQSMTIRNAVQELQARPDIDQAMTSYNQLIEQVKTELTKTIGLQPWEKYGEPNSCACTEYGDAGTRLNADIRDTAGWGAPGIPADRWPQALETLKRVTTAAGFTTAEVVKDQSGEHDLFLHGPNKSVLYFGTAKRTSLYITSGCHRIPGKPIDPDHPQNS